MQSPPTHERVTIALDKTTGDEFEEFALAFLAAKIGARFVPAGGMHDGGADGFTEDERIFENESRTTAFMQASIDADPRRKIRRTVRRLKEFGRSPTQLLYVTNQVVANNDVVEEQLSTELSVPIRIRDGHYLAAQVPTETASTAAYYQHLHHRTLFLDGVGRGSVLTKSAHVTEPHVYTYLVGELDRDTSGGSFADGVVDALIVLALEGTDPATDDMMTESDIGAKIITALPAAESLIAGRLRHRLEAISAKGNRRVRWHKPDRWALPYDERKALAQASAEDEALRIVVRQQLTDRFGERVEDETLAPGELADLTLGAIQLAFEEDGLRFSRFLADGNPEDAAPFVSDALRVVLDSAGLTGEARVEASDAIGEALRSMFYESTAEQRTLLQRISRAYGVIFALNGEPRVIRYFDDSLADTWLYVGADVIISALSERYVPEGDQHTRNLLRAATAAGAHLRLAAPVLDEVLGHLRRSDREYTDFVAPMNVDSYEVARQVPKILVRAFLYTQVLGTSQTKPRSWEHFVGQILTYKDLHTPDAQTQLRRFLTIEFGMTFEDWSQVKSVCDDQRHADLTSAVAAMKSNQTLASNDAYVFEMVMSRRSTRSEEQRAAEFGYQTWWLSGGEGAAVRAMSRVDGASQRVLMRPGFLAKFIQLTPSASVARESLRNFLPSLLGIKLARRVSEEDFHKMVETVKEAEELDAGRRAAAMADCIDRLKGARRNELDARFAPDTHTQILSVDEYYER